MPPGRPSGAVNTPKFQDIPKEWRDKAEASGPDQLNAMLVEVTKLEELNQLDKRENQVLLDAKEAYKEAGLGFKENSRMHKLMIKYALKVLRGQGQL